jgi:hypothetical protein
MLNHAAKTIHTLPLPIDTAYAGAKLTMRAYYFPFLEPKSTKNVYCIMKI